MGIYPGRAVATLHKLNRGNRMVDRCRYYLEELISVLHLPPPGTVFFPFHPLIWRGLTDRSQNSRGGSRCVGVEHGISGDEHDGIKYWLPVTRH